MYLKGKSRSNKRKTRVVQPCDSPVFKQTVKFDGSTIDNKTLEVSVWQNFRGLRSKVAIGGTEICFNKLSLDVLQTSWYNLRPLELMYSSSFED